MGRAKREDREFAIQSYVDFHICQDGWTESDINIENFNYPFNNLFDSRKYLPVNVSEVEEYNTKLKYKLVYEYNHFSIGMTPRN